MSNSNSEEKKRPDVVWQLRNDGLEPRTAPWGFIGRNPLQLVIQPRQKMTISLLVAANVPLLVFPMRNQIGMVTVGGRSDGTVVPAGTEISVTLENTSDMIPLTFGDGEGLVAIHPLLFSGSATVG